MREGFTLLEATVSLAILALVGISALGVASRELDFAARARAALESAALAEDRLESLRLLPSRELARLPDSVARGRFPAPFEAYEWMLGVEPAPDSRALYDAAVTITWEGGRREASALLHRPRRLPERP